MLAARDEIHAHITHTDAQGNDTVQIDDLASSLAQMLLGPCYTSVAVYRPRRQAAVHSHPCGLWTTSSAAGMPTAEEEQAQGNKSRGQTIGTARPMAAILE